MSYADVVINASKNLTEDEHPADVFTDLEVEQRYLDSKTLSEHRWYDRVAQYYELGDRTIVALEFDDPATEMQEGQPYNTRVYEVKPVTVQKIEYREVGK